MNKVLGRHLLIEYYGCDRSVINDKEFLRVNLLEAARKAKATIVTDIFHTFSPQGVSGVVVIAESHLAIHTWPEHGCVSIDIFSCSDTMEPKVIESFLKEALGAKRVVSREFERGKIESQESSPSLEEATI